MAISVLIVEDDNNIAELLQMYLEKEGYAVTPWRAKTWSFSWVMVSGRPASTVYSRQPERSKLRPRTSRSRFSWLAVRVVGVPPPI